MKIKALIVDDEAPARTELRYILEKIKDVEVVGEATNAAEALELIKALTYDVVFLDIQMPGLTGLHVAEVLQELPDSPAVVFVTAYGEHAVKAFELDVLDYLVKPFKEERLAQTINKIWERKKGYRLKEVGLPTPETIKINRIPVHRGDKTILLPTKDIIYINTRNDYAFIHTHHESFITSFALKELEARLRGQAFFRAHRGYIVNLHQVKEIIPMFRGTYLLRVKDAKGSEIPVSRRQAKKLKSILGL